MPRDGPLPLRHRSGFGGDVDVAVVVGWCGDHTLLVRISDRERVLGVGFPAGSYLIGEAYSDPRGADGGAPRSGARSRAPPAAGCSGCVGSAQVHGWRQPAERLARTDCLCGNCTARVPPAFGCFPHTASHCVPEVSRRRISLLGTTPGHFCLGLAPCRLIALGVILIIALPRVEGVWLPPSSSGQGHLVLSQETGVRFPVGVLT